MYLSEKCKWQNNTVMIPFLYTAAYVQWVYNVCMCTYIHVYKIYFHEQQNKYARIHIKLLFVNYNRKKLKEISELLELLQCEFLKIQIK